MFGIGRRKSRGQLAKAELNEGLGHLMQAATHAANGVGATVGPRVQAARGYVTPTATVVRDKAANGWESTMTTFAPLADAALDGARQAGTMAKKAKAKNVRLVQKKKQKQKARRRGLLAGLLIAGTVAGAASAVAMRRRRQAQQWDEYSAGGTPEPVRDDVDTLVIDTPEAGRPAAGTDHPTAGTTTEPIRQPATTSDAVKPATPLPTTAGDGVIGANPVTAPAVKPSGSAPVRP